MAKLSKAQRNQKRAERLEQQLLIISTKITVLSQAKVDLEQQLAMLRS